tara:strand:- start:11 stop:418 length:408 start_codon:yes stop_codon:yes gene_type:complete
MPIENVKRSQGFKDISFSFLPHPVTKDLPILKNERAIIRAVRNLVETIPTERFFDSMIGSEVRSLLFENYTAPIEIAIEDQIITTIRNHEPRVENVAVDVDPLPDDNSIEITVFFDIVGLDVPRQAFTFILEPTR